MEITLRDRRALITDANSAIGASIARQFADAGARVAINYLVNSEPATTLAKDLGGKARQSLAFQADVTDQSEVGALFAAIDRAWGGLDILVNSAEVEGPRTIGGKVGSRQWNRALRINLLGSFHCSREALKRMVGQRSGVILNLSSVHGRIPWKTYTAYTAAKAGLSMLTKTLAQEAAPAGVRVMVLAPGAHGMRIDSSAWGDQGDLRMLLTGIRRGEFEEPAEVARVATFLVSDAASHLTESTLYGDDAMTDPAGFGTKDSVMGDRRAGLAERAGAPDAGDQAPEPSMEAAGSFGSAA
jgi:NAD(P)-dependent dehydrogenase (short-subunit alcohol dehydrogenase family)